MTDTMKNNIALIILLIAFLSVACNERQSNNRQLILADSLMQSRPDSALCILQDISMEKLTTQADSAYYALLLTQARDKNRIVQKKDSLIRIAVCYYDSIGDVGMQAKAHYYWGCVCRDKGDYLKAIDEYHRAQILSEKGKDTELSSLIYSNVGYLYYIQDFTSKADSIYQLAAQLAVQQKDTVALVYALSQRGMINLERGQSHYPDAEKQMQQALLLAEHFSDATVKIPIYASLSTLYSEMENTEKALQYAKLNYFSVRDTSHCYRTFLLLGEAYFKNEQYDSAEIYLQKIFTATRYYDTKADACMKLAEIAKVRGEIGVVAEMRGKQIAYTDSAQKYKQEHAIFQSIISQNQKDNERYWKQYIYIVIILALIVFIVGSVIIVYYIKQSRKRQLEDEQRKQKLKVEVDLLTLKKQALIKGEYESSTSYIKLKNIARTLIRDIQ